MNNEEKVVRLAKTVKKGLIHLIFSRFFVFILLLALQVAALIWIVVFFTEKLPFVMIFVRLFTTAMVIYLFNDSMDTSAKLTWMLIIAIIPLLGASVLLFTKTDKGRRMTGMHVAEQIGKSRHILSQPEDVLERLSSDGSGTDDLCSYLNRSGCFPLYDHTASTFFPLGEDMFEAVLEELEKAEKFIFMEFFIIEEGYMWGRILEILTRKAKEGVEIRVMYDGMCEISTLPAGYWKLLNAAGIKSKRFSPLLPFVSSHYNYRDHRKILVIDGKTAFTGGVNLADEYINRKQRFGHWKDTALMLKGPAVNSFTLMFLQMWYLGEKEPDYRSWMTEPEDVYEKADGYVMPYCDCPLDKVKAGETVYIDILYRAMDYVHIMTPYLILDGELETALCYAAERGVDVRLILPGIPDKKLAYSLAKTYYKTMTEAGVKIYEYTPGFVHAKVCVSDDIKAVVGTINLDYRSLYHHFECAAYLYKTDCIAEIEEDFQKTLGKCRRVTMETIMGEKLPVVIEGLLVKAIAPLL